MQQVKQQFNIIGKTNGLIEDFRRMVARAVPGFRLTHDPMPPDFSGEDYLKRLWVDWK